MRNFIKPSEKIYFNSCSGCVDCCTNYPFAPIFLDEFESASKHFPIVFAEIGNNKFALVLLFGSANKCRYLKDNKCVNYENRVSACKIYPLMPIDNEIYLDTSCKALNSEFGIQMIANDTISEHFWHERLENFSQKKEATKQFLETIWNKLEYFKSFKGIDTYIIKENLYNNFVKFHQNSVFNNTSF